MIFELDEPVKKRVPVCMKVGDGDLIEVGTITEAKGLPALLRNIADFMEARQRG
ncbi:hypothetical protein ACFWDN_13375 [Micromonospora chalcea]